FDILKKDKLFDNINNVAMSRQSSLISRQRITATIQEVSYGIPLGVI
ncbi:19521_t:CDS:1, partial [Funneliformis geosporum]